MGSGEGEGAEFAVSCGADDCGFEEGPDRSGVGAKRPDFSRTARSGAPGAVSGAVFDAVSDVAGDVVSGEVGGVVSDPARNADSKDAVVAGNGWGSAIGKTGTGAGLADNLAAEPLTSFVLAADELGLGLEVAVWREVAWGLELGMMDVLTFELAFDMASEIVIEIDTATGVASKVGSGVAPEFATGVAPN
jgi:hypothetical protein